MEEIGTQAFITDLLRIRECYSLVLFFNDFYYTEFTKEDFVISLKNYIVWVANHLKIKGFADG